MTPVETSVQAPVTATVFGGVDLAVTVDRFDELEITVIGLDDQTATLQLVGELDLANAELLAAVIDLQAALGRRFMRLDVSRLKFCDCAGLRAIVHAHNVLLQLRGALVLVGVTRQLARLLTLSGLHEALLVADAADDTPPGRSRGHLRVVGA